MENVFLPTESDESVLVSRKDEIRSIQFVLLGRGKPNPNKLTSASLSVVLTSEPHQLSRETTITSTKILFSYFGIGGELCEYHYSVPKLPSNVSELIGWFDLLLSLETYDTWDTDSEPTKEGLMKEIHEDFINRLVSANRIARYNQRFVHAVSLVRWGIN